MNCESRHALEYARMGLELALNSVRTAKFCKDIANQRLHLAIAREHIALARQRYARHFGLPV